MREVRVCPRCGDRGRKISELTLVSHVLPTRLKDVGERDGWSICLSSDCLAIYFKEQKVVSSFEVKELPFHKNTAPDRLVCFCFEHGEHEIREEILTQDRSNIQALIKDACKSGQDDCERKNPQGRCCLGNVGRVIKKVQAQGEPVEANCSNRRCCS